MKCSTLTAAFLAVIPTIHGIPHRRATSSSGCNTALPNGVAPDQSVNRTIDSQSGASPRKYRIHLPPNYNNTTPVPLILSYHGRTQDALYQENLSKFSDASYGFQGIAVYPEGVPLIKGTKSIPQWQGDPDSHGISDTTFTLELLSHLQSTYCIDPTQIYASGKSNGAAFTNTLACNATTASKIAAFAAVAPAIYLSNSTGHLPNCTLGARKPVPFMELHGLRDPTANYTGGLNSRSNRYTADVVDFVDAWAARDGFSPQKNSTGMLCAGDKGRKVRKVFWGGDRETVVHYAYENVAHDWMSASENADTGDRAGLLTCKEAEATTLMLAWFGKWRL